MVKEGEVLGIIQKIDDKTNDLNHLHLGMRLEEYSRTSHRGIGSCKNTQENYGFVDPLRYFIHPFYQIIDKPNNEHTWFLNNKVDLYHGSGYYTSKPIYNEESYSKEYFNINTKKLENNFTPLAFDFFKRFQNPIEYRTTGQLSDIWNTYNTNLVFKSKELSKGNYSLFVRFPVSITLNNELITEVIIDNKSHKKSFDQTDYKNRGLWLKHGNYSVKNNDFLTIKLDDNNNKKTAFDSVLIIKND